MRDLIRAVSAVAALFLVALLLSRHVFESRFGRRVRRVIDLVLLPLFLLVIASIGGGPFS